MNALVILWIPYIAVPVYALFWRAAQRKKGSPTGPAWIVIGTWVASAGILFYYLFSMAWYTEHATTADNVQGAIEVLMYFVAFPLATFFYLRSREAKREGPTLD